MTMRNLNYRDIFAVSRILKKMKLKVDIDPRMTADQMGLVFIQAFMESVGDAEAEVTKLLADLKGLPEDQIKELSLDETFDLLMEFKDMPDLGNFFTKVSKLMKSE